MRWARRILLIALLVGLPVGVHLFVSRNANSISIDYLYGRQEGVAVWLALLLSFVSGAALATFVATLRGARLRLESRRYRKAARDLESEVHQLRNLPLYDEGPPPSGEGPSPPSGDMPLPASGLERGS